MEDRREEIIRLQSEIMRGLLDQRMKMIGEDLWGMPTQDVPTLSSFREQQTEKTDEKNAPGATAQAEKQPEEKKEENPPEKIEDLKQELHGYIGLNLIKDEVDSLINWVEIVKARKEHDLPAPDLSLHMVFSGNPGTGKTMIARLMARIYKSLGVLSQGQLVEVDRSGLVAGYVGQTAIKTAEVIEKAKGGVLFIDEAYALTNRGGTDYGQEAVDTLLKAMEDHRDDLVVIVAGYTELMQEFVHSNPGLESRFNRFMHFPDYTVAEMRDIFLMRCEKSGYTLAEEARQPLEDILAVESQDVEGFGNARGVRNLFEKAIAAQADRLAQGKEELTRESLMLITEQDLRAAIGEKKANETDAK
ncbi:MAG: AAA family ATPase [Clostridia bacterium]|nr:AAA family ATPase [Clostridia bacterium]